MAFSYARYQAPCKTRANNEKLKSSQNEHKNGNFDVFENVMRL